MKRKQKISIEGVSDELLDKTLHFISNAWKDLIRGHNTLIAALEDEKVGHKPGDPW